MFSYIAEIYNYFTAGSVETEQETTEDIEEESQLCCKDSDEELQRTFEGKVTSYFNTRGLVNDHIYFTRNVVLGDEPQVGDDVIAEASREHSSAGWVATKVYMNTFWNDEGEDASEKPCKEYIIGTIIDQNQYCLKVMIVNELSVSPKKLKTGYFPYRGDWIKIEIWRKSLNMDDFNNDISDNDIISISPLRQKKIHGQISEILNRHGFIDDNIYFSYAVCKKGYQPKKGDAVVAQIIESKQPRGDWRAVSVCFKRTQESKTTMKLDDTKENTNVERRVVPGITITKNLDLGDIFTNEMKEFKLCIKNSRQSNIVFTDIRLSKKIPGITWQLGSDENSFSAENILSHSMVVGSNSQRFLLVHFKPENLGKFTAHVEFLFDGVVMVSKITATVVDQLQNNITSKTPYEKPKSTFFGKSLNQRMLDGFVVPGQRPVRKKKTFLPSKLPKYPIPDHLKNVIRSGDSLEEHIPEITKPLHISTYQKKLSFLLYIEEIQLEEEMRQFDMFEVVLRPVSGFLSLNVPGLSEGRPSLLLGDRIIVKYHDHTNSPNYEGYVHEVNAEDVLLKFNEQFHNNYRNEDVDVEFYFNRTPIRRAHQAIEHASVNLGEEVLFPRAVETKEPLVHLKHGSIRPYNKSLNQRQLMAVTRIVAGCGRPAPYVLFGPPGTGKSVTVVESILQVFKKIDHSRILACAPSNSAADLLAERLHHSGQVKAFDMVRMNAFQRSLGNLPECIEPYCVSNSDDFRLATRYRIIICTCNMAGFLYSFDLKVGHFTHVFVDEAGQATEPECLIPVGFAAGSSESQIILAGDPFQLGPVLRSEIAEEYGFNISFLERLTSTKLYERNEEMYDEGYNPLVVTKLVNNYRSHKDLLSLSSRIFYDNELIPCAAEDTVNKYVGSSFLPNPNVPFIFHGLRSEDFREGNSPSWFNPMEAVQVIKYVQLLLRTNSLTQDDIGIITPYRKQVEKIRVLLEQFKLLDIKVGSVEEFQGQERICVIISTVRSNEELVDFDCYHNVGFLSNPKRFNVSITRAQALLIIVGNPVVLCYDVHWCSLLQYAVMNGCYAGCDLPALDQKIVQENFRAAVSLLGLSSTGSESVCSPSPQEILNSNNCIDYSQQTFENVHSNHTESSKVSSLLKRPSYIDKQETSGVPYLKLSEPADVNGTTDITKDINGDAEERNGDVKD